ncbi:ATP-binding protein [Romboutsia sp. MSSM.1001216sp_RTP31141st1_G3_RTP31141_220114]|uniref:HD domain-containing protein n=1 Tax=unclassified Romboutsia TaxID=2626894 RepID=UPI0031B58FC2
MNNNKYKYKLESHLKSLCDTNKEYINLYSSWEINKKTYSNILSTVQMYYPHYSLHEKSHSENIITNIEMLLGEDRIKTLSPTDTWLILNCAYIHDFGMVLLHSNIENEWLSNEFKEYIDDLCESKNSIDRDLKEAVLYIKNIKDNIEDDLFLLKIKKYVTEVVSSYYRGRHSSLTRQYLNNLKEWNLDLSQNGLIHNRLINLIGDISFLHNQNFEDVMKLDYRSNGYNSDYIHPRFVAEMIRIGDLLDLDNGRFNEYIELVIGDLPKLSKIHKEKHKATSHVLITPISIEFRADCRGEFSNEIYRETRSWIKWLEDEIKDIAINWSDIVPRSLGGYAPKITRKELLVNGKSDIDNLVDLKFRISQEKAFDIIEGSNLYEDKIVFLREFIQNALDASKIKLWRDLKLGIYDFLLLEKLKKDEISLDILSNLMPCDIDERIYKNYKVVINIDSNNSDKIRIMVKDNGIGINIETLKSMCKVGKSNADLKHEINEMPKWLRPTGNFGIGMQSAFLVADKFKAYTKNDKNSILEIEFEDARSGYISVRSSDYEIKSGTEMHIEIDEIKKFKFDVIRKNRLSNYMENDYDPFSNDKSSIYYILHYIENNVDTNIFPIETYVNSRKELELHNYNQYKLEEMIYNYENYMYNISSENGIMKAWDKEHCIYAEITMGQHLGTINRGTVNISFKGCAVNKAKIHLNSGFNIYLDIYGLNTKNTLKLDRSDLTDLGKDKVYEILDSIIKLYLNILKEKIKDKKIKNINVINYLILADRYLNNFKIEDFKEYINNEFYNFKVLNKKNEKFEIAGKGVVDILLSYPKLTYINNLIEDFRNIYAEDGEEYRYKEIRDRINKKIDEEYLKSKDFIVIDETLIECLKFKENLSDIYVIEKDEENNNDILITTNNNEYKSISVDKNTRKYFISNLAIDKEKLSSRRVGLSYLRCAIPAIEGYENLIKGNYGNIYCKISNCYKIISPITSKDMNKIKNYRNKESFIADIINREDYKNLVKFVLNNNISNENITVEDISIEYEKLIGEYFDILNQ